MDGEHYTALESVLVLLSAEAKRQLDRAEERAYSLEKEIADRRRGRILPDENQLQKIARYEAHLSREMYRALHELEALQTRRGGGASPLARVDVNVGEGFESFNP